MAWSGPVGPRNEGMRMYSNKVQMEEGVKYSHVNIDEDA